jgi:hypothetical protein
MKAILSPHRRMTAGKARLATWLLAGSLISACGQPPVEPTARQASITDAGPEDTGPLSRCDGVPRGALDCSKPVIGRVEEMGLISAGDSYIALDYIRYDSSGNPSPFLTPVDGSCAFLSGRTVPEGTFSGFFPSGGQGIEFGVRSAAPESSESRWADIQVQLAGCQRNCTLAASAEHAFSEGETSPFAEGFGILLEKVSQTAIKTVISGPSGAWSIHIQPSGRGRADFWTAKIDITAINIDADAKTADIRVEVQDCAIQ